MNPVYFPSGGIAAKTGTSQVIISVPVGLSGATSTWYSGTTDVAPAPFYFTEYECKYTIYAGTVTNNTCSAPTVTANQSHALSGTKPQCSAQVVPNSACNYTINATFGYN